MAEAAWIGLFCRDKTISVMMGSGFQKSASLVIDSPLLSCYNNDNFIKTARLRPDPGQVEWGEIPRESVTVKPLFADQSEIAESCQGICHYRMPLF